MPDKYGVVNDRYCYPGTTTLINKLNIHCDEILEKAETEFTLSRAEEYQPSFNQFNLKHLKAIHHHLFQDLYEWAGELRLIDISKATSRFCTFQRIEPETIKLLSNLQDEKNLCGLNYTEFVERSADYYCELNVIHPFRDGNGRAQRLFFEELAINAGYEFSWSLVSKDEWTTANIAGFNVNIMPLIKVFKRILRPLQD